MKFNAIIFDFDGVVFDSEKIHLEACNTVLRAFGFSISEEVYFQHYVGLSDNEMFPLILQNNDVKYTNRDIKFIREMKVKVYQAIINESKSLEGFLNVKDFICLYSNKIENLAICSGSTKIEVETVLNKIEKGELKKYFKYITTIEDVKRGKPSPEGYLLTAERLGVHPENCLAIEDTEKGASGAKAAGMQVVALSINNSVFNNVDLMARSYEEIDQWIRE